MNRPAVTALALGCAGLVPTLASAAPVDSGRMAAVSVSAVLPSGDTLVLDLRAAQMSAGPQLLIEAQRCDDQGCVTEADYLSSLPAAALSIDPSSALARLHTTLDGRDLAIAWRPTNGTAVSAGYIDGTGSAATGSSYLGDEAAATVQYAGDSVVCTGAVGQGVIEDVAVGGDEATAPVSALRVPAATTLRC